MWNDNAFTRSLNLSYPIIQAGMAGGVTTPELVIAVTRSGGLGMLGAGYMEPGRMQQAVHAIKEHVSTFGINLFVPETPVAKEEEVTRANQVLQPYREQLSIEKLDLSPVSVDLFEKQLEVVLQEHVPVCSFTFGLPSPAVVRELKKNNTTVIGTATTVQEALMNQERGMDMVVVQGSEAGGHRGAFAGSEEETMIGTMALVPQVVDQVDIPVIASGGISDGRGVLAALVLGAAAVQIGTAFVTSEESGAHALHKQAILHSSEEETALTSAFSGKPARGITNSFMREMKNAPVLPYPLQHQLTKEIRSQAAAQGKPEWMSLWSGQAPRLTRSRPAGTIMRDMVSQVNERKKAF